MNTRIRQAAAAAIAIALFSGAAVAQDKYAFDPRGVEPIDIPGDIVAKLQPLPEHCQPCGTSMKGIWTYNRHDDNNLDINGPLQIGFQQHGAWFWGQNDRHTIIGEVRGKWIKATITVAGEEGMGWVSTGEGTIHAYDELGGFVLGTLVTRDTFGRSGSLVFRRAP